MNTYIKYIIITIILIGIILFIQTYTSYENMDSLILSKPIKNNKKINNKFKEKNTEPIGILSETVNQNIPIYMNLDNKNMNHNNFLLSSSHKIDYFREFCWYDIHNNFTNMDLWRTPPKNNTDLLPISAKKETVYIKNGFTI